MTDPRIKVLRIKTGVVKRLTKEKLSYEKEAEIQSNKLEKYKVEGQEECFIKKQTEVLHESLGMVPDCQRRLAKAYQELDNILNSEEDLKGLEEYTTAQEVLKEAKPQLPALTPLHF